MNASQLLKIMYKRWPSEKIEQILCNDYTLRNEKLFVFYILKYFYNEIRRKWKNKVTTCNWNAYKTCHFNTALLSYNLRTYK